MKEEPQHGRSYAASVGGAAYTHVAPTPAAAARAPPRAPAGHSMYPVPPGGLVRAQDCAIDCPKFDYGAVFLITNWKYW